MTNRQDQQAPEAIPDGSLNSFVRGNRANLKEIHAFDTFVKQLNSLGTYAFDLTHYNSQGPHADIERLDGLKLQVINVANYNYLGYGTHPKVIQAAKDALDQYGLGAASSPILSGTLGLHRELEREIVRFFGVEDRGVSLFTSGYGVNTGTLSAVMKPGSHIILDRSAHMSLIEGANLSRANIHWFEHNDPNSLEQTLKAIDDRDKRILICTEGVYSADGDRGCIADIVAIAKQYGAMTLVDEAHSLLIAGKNGRGMSEEMKVLQDVDFIVMTFSKAFCGVGGAVLAKKEVAHYINWYARCRMFSCAMDPAVTGGILQALKLAAGPDGDQRRRRIMENSHLLASLLKGNVEILDSTTWIIPVIYGNEKITPMLSDYLLREGLETGIMTFPAVPRGKARMRIFVTSEHSKEDLQKTAQIILNAADRFGFRL